MKSVVHPRLYVVMCWGIHVLNKHRDYLTIFHSITTKQQSLSGILNKESPYRTLYMKILVIEYYHLCNKTVACLA